MRNDSSWMAWGFATVLLMLLPVVAAESGCSWIRGACAAALPTISEVQAYTRDASLAVDQAQAALDRVPMAPEQKAKVAEVIDKARLTLRAAERALVAASNSCSKLTPLDVLKEFVSAWTLIEGLLAQHSKSLGVAEGVPSVITPMIVIEARRHP